MNILQLKELTDEMMNLSLNKFYDFIEIALDKDLSELFKVQAIREMSSLSSITIDQLTQVLTFEIDELKGLKKSLGFTTSDGNFHLRLGHRKLLEHLLSLVQAKKTLSVNNRELSNNFIENDIEKKLIELLKHQTSNLSDGHNVPILIPWVINIFQNLKTTKNKYSYDIHIQQFALLIYIFGESLIRNQEMRMIESEFRFQLIKEHLKPNKCNYVFIAEDATSSICRIDYDATSNSFIGFSSPLIDGVAQSNFFQTENFEQLELWLSEIDKAKFINLYMLKSLVLSDPPFILTAYGSNNKAKAIEILKRWLFIYHQCLIQDIHVIGFSTDADSRFLRAMRLCSRFFATLPNFNILKYKDIFHIKIPKQWSWFFMEEQQILFFMQDGIHIATKFRNQLLSETAHMKIGSYSIDIHDVFDLIELESKIEHTLIKCDVDPKDRQNFASCLRISSKDVLNLLEKNEKATGTFVYLSLLRSIIAGFIERSTTIEQRLFHIWTVVFTFIKNKLPVDALNTFAFNSQICENTFRIARSLSGSFSSNTHFSVKSFLKRCEKISIINSIKNHGGQIGEYQFYFPQHHKNHKDTCTYSIDHINELNLTEIDIEIIIKNAFEEAKKYVSMVNMTDFLKAKNIYTLSSLSTFTRSILNRSSSKRIDYTIDNNSSDEDSDEENLYSANSMSDVLNNEDQFSPNNTDDEEEEEENVIAIDVPHTAQTKLNGCRIYDKINPQQSKKYFGIRIGSSYKFIHKQTSCWLLTTDKQRL
ncbi:unnamed protein product [Rotaria socialis]|uniref:Uncharacterized protein n=1 Tax=Rotaria socialis TaxID=392032 RepID=A0A817U8J4_9BILA|nr:unnamed protein product [Rotaria socialis]CAF3327386.1 unnamed protein product [Rotaria socialis]CAF3431577.1 unnamed protein product [Rotaria socialis]CAF3494782.1 unnamed protein product [Rotaria socialis]CAF4510715.1 unnamed protein product [Rotaria socialis]